MKKLVVAVVLLLTIFLACNKEDKMPEWSAIGTVEKTDEALDDFEILLDAGDRLIPNKTIYNNDFENGDRILVYYSIINSLGNDTYDVDLYDIDRILTKDVIQLTEAIQDSIGNDPVYINEDNVWISDKYLNFIFSYYGGYETHYINLVKLYGNTHTEDGRLILELRHNAHNDYAERIFNGVVSFDLESLKEPDLDSLEFLVRVNKYDDDTLEWEGTYTFNSELKSLKKENNLPKNLNLKISSDYLK